MKIHLPSAQNAPQGKLEFDYTTDLSQEVVHFEKPFQSPVRIFGLVSDSAGMVRLEGVIEAEVSAHCARCDKPVSYMKQVEIRFMLATALEDEDVDDIWVVDSDDVELNDIFVPELIMDMDMSVLCSEDCVGLCPKCGHNLNHGECGCDRHSVDPRLAVLEGFRIEPDDGEKE